VPNKFVVPTYMYIWNFTSR